MKYLQRVRKEDKVILDMKNRKILNILSQNSRTPSTNIAKKVGLSRDAVSYRINNLANHGVIQGYRTIIDIRKFGYEVYHVFLQLNHPTKESEKRIINRLKKHSFIRAIIKFSGNYDLELALVAKSILEFDEILGIVLNECSQFLNQYEILAITKNYIQRIFPKSFLKNNNPPKLKPVPDADTIKIDEKDIQILKIISENANTPLYKIANKIKLSADAVNYRIKNMIKQKIIIKFVPIINYAVLSYNVYALLLSIPGLTKEKESKLHQLMDLDDNLLWAVKSIGKFNILAYICADNPDKVHATLSNLANYLPKDIKSYQILIAYEEYKYTYFPF